MAESTIGQDIQGAILEAVRKGQEVIVDAIEGWAATVQSIRPDVPQLPCVEGIGAKLPRPEGLIMGAYDIAEQLLASQRKFAEDVLKATAPLRTSGNDTAS